MNKHIIVKPLNKEVESEAKFMNVDLFKEGSIPWIIIKKPEDEDIAVSKALIAKKVIVSFEDDSIIPLENIIAKIQGKAKVYAHARSIEDAKIALDTLEIGADGVVLETGKPEDITKIFSFIESNSTIQLQEAIVTVVKLSGIGYRVCVDTAELMKEGEGLLVGTSSSGLFLVEAEVKKNNFVSSRPFRVNSGAISLYTLLPNNKTQYLSELSAGSEVLVVDREGKTRTAIVARCKLEKRPLVLVEAEIDNIIVKGLYQNAETIRFVQKEGSIEITELKVGDKILARVEIGGRHFGMRVENETIIEK